MIAPRTIRTVFPGHSGHELSARLDLPAGPIRAIALFAHCFTCGKDLLAAKNIAATLVQGGIAVLRFDFTGLGSSEGEFANTNFSSNVADLVCAADFLRRDYEAPTILIGHSLGGAAVLAAAGQIAEAKAVVTIGAPANVDNVLKQFSSSIAEISEKGEARVSLAGRSFTIARSFIEDARTHKLEHHIASLKKALLVMHAPKDEIVAIENASKIFLAAKHPKSFISLDRADHLLTNKDAAEYAATAIAAWVSNYIPKPKMDPEAIDHVLVTETGQGKFQNTVMSGAHKMLADEPVSVGGHDSGPNPYDYLAIALGSCTSMTLRIYSDFKKLNLGSIAVKVTHGKVAADHCRDCGEAVQSRTGQIDRFERVISVAGPVSPELGAKIIEIANKCPVHSTLQLTSVIVTKLGTP